MAKEKHPTLHNPVFQAVLDRSRRERLFLPFATRDRAIRFRQGLLSLRRAYFLHRPTNWETYRALHTRIADTEATRHRYHGINCAEDYILIISHEPEEEFSEDIISTALNPAPREDTTPRPRLSPSAPLPDYPDEEDYGDYNEDEILNILGNLTQKGT
jgi:hypothetical protein